MSTTRGWCVSRPREAGLSTRRITFIGKETKQEPEKRLRARYRIHIHHGARYPVPTHTCLHSRLPALPRHSRLPAQPRSQPAQKQPLTSTALQPVSPDTAAYQPSTIASHLNLFSHYSILSLLFVSHKSHNQLALFP
ncbi:hypothetical protein E2C01_010588 [Portunus trituberculatus]|uniref:Uncharacterized protein n=1 Tax=Portunus trituberculatus TaxID=210409 RepID=A0A5B7D8V5_PORTR|nr:hypothetical protein [Portunus trituberculatus]